MKKDLIQKITEDVISQSCSKNKWLHSNNEKIKPLSTTEKGTIGEKILESFIKGLGNNYRAEFPQIRRGDYDVRGLNLLNNIHKDFESKLATQDSNGAFQFNAMKLDAEYDYLFCLGISPNEEWFQIIKKDNLFDDIYMKNVFNCKLGSLYKKRKNEKIDEMSYKLTLSKSKLRPISELSIVLKEILNG
jgi:hypothetical protein